MAENNFWVDLVASLNKSKSKSQIKSDIKEMGEIKFPLVGTLNKFKTKSQIKSDLESISGSVNLNAKVNKKNVTQDFKNITDEAQAQMNKTPVQITFTVKKDKLVNDIKVFAQQNSKLFKDANMSAKYDSLLNNAKLAQSSSEIKDIRTQLSAMRSELKANNLAGLTLGDTLKKTAKRAAELFASTGGAMLVAQQIREAWTQALNLDKAYTDLIKVQDDLTRSDYPEYLDRCNKKAKDLAATQQGLMESMTEFSKSGYDASTSDKLTDKATMLANVGDMSDSDAAKAIISGVQAYKDVDGYTDAVGKAQALIDKYNEIGNTASITTQEIAEGVESVGSVFADANTSVDEFIALLSAGNRQFQDADNLSLGLRTSALRIRGCTAELEAMGEETDDVYTSTSKLADKIAGLTNVDGSGGVQILEADGETFRSIYDIFVDISKVYDHMSDTDASALLDLIAGKNRSSGISAVLNNMSEAQEIYQNSIDATGSAQKEYNTYLDSSDASLNRFKANMTETYQSVINGNITKGILDSGNAVLQFANDFGIVESTVKGFVAIGLLKVFTSLSTAFKATALQASNFGTALNTVKNMSNMTKGTTEYKNALQSLKIVSAGLSEAQLKQVLANESLSNSERIRILMSTGLKKSQAEAKIVEMGLTQATNAQSVANNSATASTFSFKAAVTGLGASLKATFMSNPIGISIMALSVVIGAVTSKVSEYNEQVKEARQANIDAATTASEQADSLNDAYQQYVKLADITNRTSSQEEEFQTAVLDITKALGDKAEVLSGLTAGTDAYAEALKGATKAELENSYATAVTGRKAAEEQLQDDAYSNWDGSKVTIQLNEQMTGIENHVKALETVRDLLSEFEDAGTNGQEWEPINWDKDNTNMDSLVQYYNSLIEARKALIMEAQESGDESVLNSDIYKDMDTVINSLTEDVDTYVDKKYEEIKLEYEMQNGIPSTVAEYQSMKQSLLDASSAGDYFNDTMSSMLAEDFSDLSSGVQNAANSTDNLANATSKISTSGILSENIEAIDAYQTKISKIEGYISDLRSGSLTNSGVVDIMQELGIDPSEVDMSTVSFRGLEEQLKTIAQTSFDDLKEMFGDLSDYDNEDAMNNLIDSFEKMKESATNLVDTYSNLESEIDKIQSSYSALQGAVDEYNAQGYLSLDTLQSLMDLDDSYLACLVNQNGQLSINEQYMAALTQSKLDAAQAAAVNQAMTELEAIANGEYAQSTTDYVTGNANLVASLATLSGSYDSVASAAMTAAQAQALSADIAKASSVDSTATKNVMSGLNAKLKLIQGTKTSISSGNFKTVSAKPSTSSSSGSSSSKDTWKEAFEAEYDALQHLHNMEQISDEQYYNSVNALNEKYFANNTKYSDEYAKYQEEVYKGLKSVYKDYIDSNTKLLKAQLDSGKITYQDYSSKVGNMLDEMYSSGKISAQEYFEYVEDKLNNQLDVYDAVLSAVETLFDDEIDKIQDSIDELDDENDKLNEQKDIYDSVISAVDELYDSKIDDINESIDALEKENDALSDKQELYDSVLSAVNKVYQNEIDGLTDQKNAIQDVIDAMSDENDERSRSIALQTAMYNLARAQAQNSKLVYKNGQMVYTNDASAVNEYQNSVKDAQYAIDVAELQKQQNALDDAIEILQDYMEMWGDVASAYSEIQDEMNAKMVLGQDYAQMVLENNIVDINNFKNQYVEIQSQIDDNTELINSYNQKVEYYNNLKSEWDKLSSAYETETNRQHASQMLGANWEAELLNGRYQNFDNFKNGYLNIQRQINSNDEMISSYNQKVAYYQGLKDQWASISEEYEKQMNRQYAAQVLGADWESNVLSGRLDTLTSFKNDYISLQQQIADAAVNSANAQVEAAKNAAAAVTTANASVASSSGSGGSSSGSSTSSSTSASTERSDKYWVYKTLGSYSTNGEATSKIGMLNGDGVIKSGNKYLVVKWKKGYSTCGQASSNISNYGGSGVYKRYKNGSSYIPYDQLAYTQDDGQEMVYDSSDGGLLTRLGKGDKVFTNSMTDNLYELAKHNPIQSLTGFGESLDYSYLGNTNNSNTVNVTIAPGAIVLNDVQDVNTLGNAIATQLPNILNQKLNKMK